MAVATLLLPAASVPSADGGVPTPVAADLPSVVSPLPPLVEPPAVSTPVDLAAIELAVTARTLPALAATADPASDASGPAAEADLEATVLGRILHADDAQADADDADGTDADEVADEPAPAVYEASDGERITAERLRDFLDGRGSPMAAYAQVLVDAGVAHDVDPRVVVAIAVAESNAGKRLPSGSHNAWGWGGSGPHGLTHWPSWEASIDDYTERLGRRYDTEQVDESFARTYCPPNWRWWLDTVSWAIGAI